MIEGLHHSINPALLSGSTAPTLKPQDVPPDIEEAAKEFESVYIAEMIKPMFEGIETEELFGGGKGEEIFRGMLISEYGKILASANGIGLAEHVKSELMRIQEGQNHVQQK